MLLLSAMPVFRDRAPVAYPAADVAVIVPDGICSRGPYNTPGVMIWNAACFPYFLLVAYRRRWLGRRDNSPVSWTTTKQKEPLDGQVAAPRQVSGTPLCSAYASL